jgi:tRNA A37 threonylcarbamoyladenosine dehydratase
MEDNNNMNEIKITIDPQSYAEFMGLDLDYVIENWDTMLPKIIQECENIFG